MKMLRSVIISILFCCTLPAVTFAQERSGSIVTIEGVQYYIHTVTKGETVYGLSRLYNVTEDELLASNPHIGGNLREEQVIKIPVNRAGEKELNRRQMRRTFDVHTVRTGETLYGISRQYGISLNVLLEDNPGLDPVHLREGMSLNVRKKEQGDASGWQIAEEMGEYRDAINSVTMDGQYYLVESNETLYGIAKQFGISVEELEAANDLRGGLKAGQLIKIPGKSLVTLHPGEPGYTFESRRDSLEYARARLRDERETPIYENVIRDISDRKSVNISLLLPLTTENGAPARDRENFIHFYQGMLIGLEDLKNQGINTNLTLFNTSRSLDVTDAIINSPEFRNTDLVIGPVYEEGLLPVITFAENQGIPVVSPLQQLDDALSPVLYQMAPSHRNKYDKLKVKLAKPGLNIIYVTTQAADSDMNTNLRPVLPLGAKEIHYSVSDFASALERNLDRRNADNVIVVSCTNMQVVDRILGDISSVYRNLVDRSQMSTKVNVVGNSAWARFPTSSVDHDLYFKVGLCYVTNYHADNNDQRVSDFTRRYIENFNTVPTPFSYRGYDAAKLFAGALMTRGNDFERKVNESNQTLLQIPYHFEREAIGGDYRNTNWVLVCYGSDYTIRIE